MLNVKVTKQQMLWNNPPELKQHNFSDGKSGKKTKKTKTKKTEKEKTQDKSLIYQLHELQMKNSPVIVHFKSKKCLTWTAQSLFHKYLPSSKKKIK